ncbi:hypothetical protein O6H91_20G044500 [Diphasiastrum complanatum]|uniref:Uncharacterized protein n=2 Tax=Diphasiastrum complanatum TaxID=34168 RepID=A0ACC2APX4_DIPCM|nr:hypothetical protein O6H91_20G044500 [Diphasiastrum complanatum]KAJ7519573.1 hypothetical protein O6H91_20G044500 [Diphasiastrum complanatum]
MFNRKLQDNLISGSIPSELGNLQQLTNLDLSNNNFSGVIPSSFGNLSSIRTMLLNNNSLEGSIPTTLTNLPDLQMLDLSYNNLSGSIPQLRAKLIVVGNPNLCGTKTEIACPGAPPPSTISNHGSSTKVIVAGVAASVSFLVISSIIGFLSWNRYHAHHKEAFFDVAAEDDPEVAFGQLKKYAFRELQVATDNFSDKNAIGQGGFGKVFKGVLPDGSVVAVKRLKAGQNRAGGEHAFQTEVEIISLAVHRHLLRLQGFCVTPSERILVYPYMKNGCVASCLRNEAGSRKQALTWPVRKRIALGAAQGLRYLHDHCNPKIIHRDVKAANVLLNENFEAVVGDFGLAKLLDYKNTHVTTNVRGTPGHIAPEYLSTGKSSEKTDVFGYGITLLELITGKRAFDLQRLFEEDVMLLDWVKRFQREKRLKELVDSSLGNDYNQQEAEELIKVALLCTQASPMERPKMAEVVGMLEGTGLAERWEEWQKMELVRRQEMEQGPHRLSKWMEDSGSNLEAIELTAGR